VRPYCTHCTHNASPHVCVEPTSVCGTQRKTGVCGGGEGGGCAHLAQERLHTTAALGEPGSRCVRVVHHVAVTEGHRQPQVADELVLASLVKPQSTWGWRGGGVTGSVAVLKRLD
jgi:hypothetical protein